MMKRALDSLYLFSFGYSILLIRNQLLSIMEYYSILIMVTSSLASFSCNREYLMIFNNNVSIVMFITSAEQYSVLVTVLVWQLEIIITDL